MFSQFEMILFLECMVCVLNKFLNEFVESRPLLLIYEMVEFNAQWSFYTLNMFKDGVVLKSSYEWLYDIHI